jgi:hypothetical protein
MILPGYIDFMVMSIDGKEFGNVIGYVLILSFIKISREYEALYAINPLFLYHFVDCDLLVKNTKSKQI